MSAIDDEIAAIREAIAIGARKIVTQTNGVRNEVEYPSFKDLKDRLDFLEGQSKPKRRVILASF